VNPTFIGIGPARCGTTSVYYYLRQHPQIFMSPIKEPHYFTYQAAPADFGAGRLILNHPVKSRAQYDDLFKKSGGAAATGEISPSYFWGAGVADAIHAALPEVRLFCILRDPAERAYSAYRHYFSRGTEMRSLEQALSQELESPTEFPRAATNYYVRAGYYARQLAPYLERFGRQQLKILFYEDLEASASQFMRELFDFIGVDPDFPVDTSSRFNTSSMHTTERGIRALGVWRAWKQLRRLVPQRLYYWLYRGYSASLTAAVPVPSMPTELRGRLIDAYAADIRALQALTGRDLSRWLVV